MIDPSEVPRKPGSWHQTFVLAGDIGGTNSRLVLYDMCGGPAYRTHADGQGGVVVFQKDYENRLFDDFLKIVQEFLVEAGNHKPKAACIAVAGPVVENVVVLTNIQGWVIDGNKLQEALGIPRVKIVNDFAAVGYGLLTLEDSECRFLNAGQPQPGAPILCIGAGTGLGECYLAFQGNRYEVFASEGGHSDFPARDALELELVDFIKKKYNLTDNRVSVERVVSGGGIENIYDFLRTRFPDKANPEVVAEFDAAVPSKRPKVVNTNTDKCLLADQAIDIFLTAYGSEVGNCSLKFLPRGGIYIAGGLIPKFIDRAAASDSKFLAALFSKGRMSKLIREIPIRAVMDEYIGLRGAKLLAARMLPDEPEHH